MVSFGLRKLAAEHGMRIARGVAYGQFYGYAATFYEGMGWKEIVVSLCFADAQKREALSERMQKKSIRKRFKLLRLEVERRRIIIRFFDDIGTMRTVRAFCKWFFPLLDEYGAKGTDFCPICGKALDGSGKWKLANNTAMLVHESCAEDHERRKTGRELRKKESGSYARGFAGALLGGLLGSVFWIFTMYLGFYHLLCGFILGILAAGGYELFRGRPGRGKAFILALAVLLCTVFGNFVGFGFVFLKAFREQGIAVDFAYAFDFYLQQIKTNPDLQSALVKSIPESLFIAYLGAASLLLRSWRRTRGFRMQNLE